VNEGTGDRRQVQTDSSGFYQFLTLTPATYRLEAESTGFKRFVRTPIVIEVNRAVAIDIRLEVGSVTESIEVIAATPLLEGESS
ncbi:MAG: carboxypeptidase regulatory-like domain-containing protein, partial [Acidobacteria bacterium]|nr:carboxypeptidase regulatory-like domain-containing protein [Acidobacteriota bacterium]